MISICIIVKNVQAYYQIVLGTLISLGYEIIIVDTGSTDKTKQWLTSTLIRYTILYGKMIFLLQETIA